LSASLLAASLMLAALPSSDSDDRSPSPRQSAPLATVCGMSVPAPAALPPDGSPPVVVALSLCFEKQGGSSLVDPQTYLYYLQVRPSEPSRNVWVTYTDEVEAVLLGDFRRLWATNFLDDLAIDVQDYPLANGVIGKVVVFNMEERQRIKIVDYEGLARIDRTDIDKRLRDKSIDVRLDSFIDQGALRRVATVVRELYAEKGYQFAEVTPVVRAVAGGPKLVNVTFNVVEGPQVAIRDVEFVGNKELNDETLSRAMKSNKAQSLLSFIRGSGVYQVEKFGEDAEAVVGLYRDHGYIAARVGQPELRPLEDSKSGTTRWIQLRIPVTEGRQYTIGQFTFEGNTKVTTEALAAIFKIKSGDTYSEKQIRKGLDKVRELYGAGGYYEFTAYPDLQPRDVPPADEPDAGPSAADPDLPPVVDVTMRVQEGAQYFVNRITFLGNTHTRDDVLRRELALVEAGIFNTEALKFSIRRLNQLGYFKSLEGDAISVEKTAGKDNNVDVVLKVEEQNRNQVSFGAGASQYEGIFGNASFTTSNFLGRGESLTLSFQKGSRSNSYQVAFSEPYLFGRPITAGISLFSRKLDYRLYSAEVDYSEVRTGATLTSGFPIRRFTRVYASYGYEVIDTASSAALKENLATGGISSFALSMDEGRHIQSSISPSIVHNTVDNPYAPRSGMRLTGTYQYAGGLLGGTTHFAKPELEAIVYLPVTRKTAFGMRANAGWLWNYSSTALPYYLRYFLGGETQIRGTDIRTVGPMNDSDVALGGTKFVLFNAEYYYDIAPQVRALLFHDAGQAYAESSGMDLRQLRTSTGAELRVTLPMIGVPMRLIYAWNFYRDTFQPARTFKFAVGTTF
jgi:outer membrane protein insertion porin family